LKQAFVKWSSEKNLIACGKGRFEGIELDYLGVDCGNADSSGYGI
jgi:hypothetical protein